MNRLIAWCLLAACSAATASGFFEDVTAHSGIDFTHVHGGSGKRYLPETMGAGGAVLDYDGDGWMDVFLVQSGPLPGSKATHGGHRLFRNLGNGRFRDVSRGSGLERDRSYGQGAVAADYDGDGRTDLLMTSLDGVRLFRNEGNGRFSEHSAAAGVVAPGWSSSAVFFDADQDRDLDLYIVRYLDFSITKHRDCSQEKTGLGLYCHPDVYPALADVFFRNMGDGRFEEATASAGFASIGKGLGAVALDFDQDHDLDLYIANDSTPNFLYVNDGHGRFEEDGLLLGVALNEDGRPEAGMGVDAGDVNGDGRDDVFVTNLSMEPNALYLGSGDGFRYATRAAGLYAPSLPKLGFGTALADFDNDGDLDLYVVNGDVQDNIALLNDRLSYAQASQLFLNDGRGRFRELGGPKLGAPAKPRVGRALLVIDYDNDGRLDVLVTHSNDRARLYRNRGAGPNFIGFDPQGCSAIGARRLLLDTSVGIQYRSLRIGAGYQSGFDPRLHLGLGTGTVRSWRLRFADGTERPLDEPQLSAYARTGMCVAETAPVPRTRASADGFGD